MMKKQQPEFVLSMLGGIMLLGYGMVFLAGLFIGLPPDESMERMRLVMGEKGFVLFQIRVFVAGVSSGSAMVLLSIMLKRKPEESKHWGIMIVILSIVSVLGMGFINIGILPAIVIGIIGGILAIMKGRKTQFTPLTSSIKDSENFSYRCSICNIDYKSDEELREHLLRQH